MLLPGKKIPWESWPANNAIIVPFAPVGPHPRFYDLLKTLKRGQLNAAHAEYIREWRLSWLAAAAIT